MDDPHGAVSTVTTSDENGNYASFASLTTGVQFLEGRLILPESMPFDQWFQLGNLLFTIERNAQWWVGEWIRYGERSYGERYSQAIQMATGYAASSLANMAYVAGRFDPSRRREELTFSHHAAVASLPPDEQDELLDRAERDHLPVRALYEAVRVRRGEVPLPTLDEAVCEHEFQCRRCGEVRS
jgi:hypothetical protein